MTITIHDNNNNHYHQHVTELVLDSFQKQNKKKSGKTHFFDNRFLVEGYEKKKLIFFHLVFTFFVSFLVGKLYEIFFPQKVFFSLTISFEFHLILETNNHFFHFFKKNCLIGTNFCFCCLFDSNVDYYYFWEIHHHSNKKGILPFVSFHFQRAVRSVQIVENETEKNSRN